MKSIRSTQWTKIAPYAVLSLGSMLFVLCLLALMISKASVIHTFGLVRHVYFVILVLLGLSSAAFLFGALRSIAILRMKQPEGTAELKGSIAGCVAIIILGLPIISQVQECFTLTAYVCEEGHRQSFPLRSSGYAVLDLGGERRRVPIDPLGEAIFPGIPSRFYNQHVPLSIDAAGFEVATTNSENPVLREFVYLPVRKSSARVAGRVQDESGRPVVGASVKIDEFSIRTDKSGHFAVSLPAGRRNSESVIDVLADGFAPWHGVSVCSSSDSVINLTP